MTTSFKDQAWSSRFAKMGDEAEQMFEQTWPHNWERFGLQRPRLAVGQLPTLIRYMPDYLTTRALVEVQGFGRDQMFKLKHEKLLALQVWDSYQPVLLYLWDTTNRQYGDVGLRELLPVLERDAVTDTFPEGKTFLKLPAQLLPMEWTAHE